MSDSLDPREQLKNSLRELQDLRREKHERAAILGAACRLSGAHTLAGLAARAPAVPLVAPTLDLTAFGVEASAPHLGLLLAAGWEALEHAGRPPANLPAERVGVFIGIGGSEPPRPGAPRLLPALHSAQTLARAFGFRGPAVNVDAGDASALAAVDLACRALLAREVDYALAGGVALVADETGGPDRAAGCGLVVLKRVSDATSQRDNVLAVVQAHRLASAVGDPLADLPRRFAGVAEFDPQAISYLGLAGPQPSVAGAAVHHAADAGHLNGLVALLHALLAVQFGPSDQTAVTVAAGQDSWAGLALRAAPPPPATADPGPYLLLLSAPDAPALAESATHLAAHLRAQPAADLAAVAYTLRAGRIQHAQRLALVAANREAALAALEQSTGAQARCDRVGRPPVFLFPGLGSHYLNMAAGLYQAEPMFREAVDDCARLLQPHLGLDIRTLFLTSTAASPSAPAGQLDLRKLLRRPAAAPDPAAARLDQTLHAQPALFVVEYALARLLAAWGVKPAALLGFSLGEYVAACLAGVLSLDDALFLVATRARLIQALPAGQMLAVPLSEAELAPWLDADLSVSAVIGRAVCVVAGPPAPIAALAARLAAESIAAQVLPTTHAFHTEMLRPIAAPFTAALGQVRLNPPVVPYVSNLTGDWITAADATSPAYWVEHACRPVRFAAGVETLHRAGYDLFVEVGPAAALTSLVTALARDLGAEALRAVPTMRADYDPQPDAACLYKALGDLWLAGAAVDWENFHPARRVALPASPFPRAADVPLPAAGQGALPLAVPLTGTPTEQALAALWCDLLKLPAVDPRHTFFEQGGNSLLAAQLIFRIRKTFGTTLPLRALFEAPGLEAMARLIDHPASPAPAASDPPPALVDGLPVTLPNGLAILCQNQPEVGHFYEDIFVDRVYASHGLTLAPGAVVFDVGANIGLFSLFAHLEAPGARLFAFEPAPPLFGLLQANLTRHGVAATAYNCALSSQPGTAEFTYYPKSTGMSSLYADLADEKMVLATVLRNQVRRGERELEVLLDHADDYLAERFKAQRFTCPLRTLSAVIAEAGVDRIDLLKIDVQKAELDVLLGLAEADWPKVRQIVVEVHDSDGRLAQMRQMLAAHGFQVATAQEALYAGSPIYLLYGTRPAGA